MATVNLKAAIEPKTGKAAIFVNETIPSLMRKLFSNGEQGFFYDPNDLSTMYQDAAGTIPVTAAGQPVGLILDKSKGLVLGSNIIPNGSFSSDTSWGKGAGWTIADGVARFDGSASFSNLGGVASPSINGKWLRVELDLSNVGALVTQVRILASGALAATIPVSGAGKYSAMILGGAVPSIGIQTQNASGANCAFTLDNVSVKEAFGNHAYQTVSASRPILQQTPILGNELVVNGTFDTNIVGWEGSNGGQLSAIDGALRLTNTLAAFGRALYAFSSVPGKTYKVACSLRSGGGTNVTLGAGVNNGSVSLGSVATTSTVYENKDFVFTAQSETTYLLGVISTATVGLTAFFDSISVKEITGYRTDQNYLAFDGVDDFLQTNELDLSAAQEVTIFAGVTKLRDTASYEYILANGNVTSETGLIRLRLSSIGKSSFEANMSGAYVSTELPDSGVIPQSRAIIAKASSKARSSTYNVNGVLVTKSNVFSYGAVFSNLPLYIGRQASSSWQANMHLYGLILVAANTSNDIDSKIQREIAKKMGVTLNV